MDRIQSKLLTYLKIRLQKLKEKVLVVDGAAAASDTGTRIIAENCHDIYTAVNEEA